MTDYEYEITYTLRRRALDGGGDFTEIGFGTGGMWSTPDQSADGVLSDIQSYAWDTEDGMPDPEDVRRDVEQARDQ